MSQRPARRRGRGRRALLILLLLTVFGAAFLWWSNRSLQVDRFTYASPRLPAGFDGCVVVQLSDLHGAIFGENNQDLVDAVRAENPDYIFLTGDLLDRYRRTPQSYAVDLGRAMAAIAPTYFVTGNHEWALPDVPGLKAQLEEAGVTVLSNEFTTLERNGDAIVLAGIDDPNGPYDQKTPEELSGEIHAALGDPYVLLLAHRNEYYQVYGQCGFDLTLCGHVHGGLIRLPFTDGLVDNTRRRFFPTHTAGLYPLDGGGTLMVSRGLGNGGISFRLFNRPHLPVIVLKAGA